MLFEYESLTGVSYPCRATTSLEVHGLSKRAVSRRVPHGEPHPLLSRRIEWHAEFVAAMRRHCLHVDHLPVNCVSITPHQFRKFGREGPFRFRRIGTFCAGAFDTPVAEEHFAAGHKIVSGAQSIHNRSPAVV